MNDRLKYLNISIGKWHLLCPSSNRIYSQILFAKSKVVEFFLHDISILLH